MFRVYPNRNKIRALWLGLKQYYEISIDSKTKEKSEYKNFKYKRPSTHGSIPAHRFRLGTNCQDKMFRKNDYSIYSNFFHIDDAAYMREFYVLYNQYGLALANGRKNKLLVKTIPPPFPDYHTNFMDKEKLGIFVSNLKVPVDEENPEGYMIDFSIYLKQFKMLYYSVFERKLIENSQIFELIGLKSLYSKAKWSVTCFGSTMALYLDGLLFFLTFSSKTEKFEFAKEKCYDFRTGGVLEGKLYLLLNLLTF